MTLQNIPTDLNVQGTLSCAGFVPPVGVITDASIQSGAGIEASKLNCHFRESLQLFPPGTAITAVAAQLFFIAKNAGAFDDLRAIITTQATDPSRTVTIDLQKSTGAGAFASVLSAPLSIGSTTPVLTAQLATITTPDYVAGDVFELIVAVAGGSGNQAKGLLVSLKAEEEY